MDNSNRSKYRSQLYLVDIRFNWHSGYRKYTTELIKIPQFLYLSLSLLLLPTFLNNTPQSPAVTAPLKRGACPYPLPPLLRGGGCVSSRRGVLLQGEVPSIARRRGVPTEAITKQPEGCSGGGGCKAAGGVLNGGQE